MRGRIHKCGSTIINSRWVLTTASCISDFNSPRAFQVRTGISYSDREGSDYSIINSVIHPNYLQGRSDYDIALLKTQSDIEFSKSTQPIVLTSEKNLKPGMIGKISGWGYAYDSYKRDTSLHSVFLKIISNAECQEKFLEKRITKNVVCVSSQTKKPAGLCYGDAGSPFVIDKNLVGIASFDSGCGLASKPGIITRIDDDAIAWIFEAIKF